VQPLHVLAGGKGGKLSGATKMGAFIPIPIIQYQINYDEYSYDTPYLQDCTEKKMVLNFFS
jgi:hypothetical protein